MRRRLDWLLPSWLENVDAYSQSIDADIISVAYTIVVNLCIFTLCVLIFTVVRQYVPDIYHARYFVSPDRVPPRLRIDTLFGWVVDIWKIDDELIISKAGYDALFLIRFYRLCLNILVYSSIFCFLVLIPLDGTGGSTVRYSSFDRWSMTNIEQGSPRCWLHVLGIYIFTGITIYFLEKEFILYAKYRHDFLRQTHAHLRTVLIEGIPRKMRSPTTLYNYLNHLYPNNVLYIRLGINLKNLQTLISERDEILNKLEHCLYRQHLKQVRPMVKIGNMTQPVDAIQHYSQQLDYLNQAIADEQQLIRKLTDRDNQHQAPHTPDSNKQHHDDTIHEQRIDAFLKVTEISVREKSSISRKKGEQHERTSSTTSNPVNVDIISEVTPETKMTDEPNLSDQEGYVSFRRKRTDDGADDKPDHEDDDGSDHSQNALLAAVMQADAEDSEDEGDDEVEGGYYIYTLSVREFIHRLWSSQSWTDFWHQFRTLYKSKRDDYQSIDEENDKLEEGVGKRRKRKNVGIIHDADLHDDKEEGDESSSLLMEETSEHHKLYLSKAFVTFTNFTTTTTARQVIHMQLPGHMAISEAPEPTDITWDNLYRTRKGSIFRRYLVEMLIILLIVVWVAPVTMLSYIFSADAIYSAIPIFYQYSQQSELFDSLIDLIQPLILVGIMNLLPPLLTALGTFEGCIAMSINQFRAFHRYFGFQIINVFLVNVIAGSVIDVVAQIYEDPQSAFSLLGTSLPKMGGFFTSYLLVKAFTGLGLELIRFPALFSHFLKTVFTETTTIRDKKSTPLFGALRDIFNPGWFPYAKIYAQDMLLFVICATYSCIAPLTLIAGMCYFGVAIYVYKHQMVYIYEVIYETGGRWWVIISRCFVVALIFAQATLIGMLLLKETYSEIYFVALLLGGTLSYYWHVSSIYIPLAQQLPLDMAVSMDQEEKRRASMDTYHDKGRVSHIPLHGADDYLQPSLRAMPASPIVSFPINSADGSSVPI